MLVQQDVPIWMANMLNMSGTLAAVATIVTMGTQKRCRVSKLKISLWAAQGDWSICPVMDVSSPESSGGREWLYLLVRMFPLLLSLLDSSHVSVTEVCPAARLHVRRILSLSIKWTLNPPQWKRQLHNNTRISGVQELYSSPPPQTSSCCSVLSFCPSFIHSPGRTFSPH